MSEFVDSEATDGKGPSNEASKVPSRPMLPLAIALAIDARAGEGSGIVELSETDGPGSFIVSFGLVLVNDIPDEMEASGVVVSFEVMSR